MLTRKEKQEIWRKNNPNYQKEYAEKNKEKIKQRKKDYNKLQKTKDKKNEYQKKLKQKNPEEYRVKNCNYSKRSKTAGGILSLDIISKLKVIQNGVCVYCGININTNPYELDHIIPFNKGGLNTDDNVQLLCYDCNKKKYNKTHDEYIKTIGMYKDKRTGEWKSLSEKRKRSILLTNKNILEIRALAKKISVKEIAQQYKVSIQHIYRIINYESRTDI